MEIAVLVVILEFICIICLAAYIVYSKRKQPSTSTKTDATTDVEKLKLYSEFNFDRIDDIIDKFINSAGDKYRMENFEYKDPEDVYLKEQDIDDMSKYLIKEVRKRITPAILDLLKLSYNINTEDDLLMVIYNRVEMYVLSYSIEANSTIE